MVIFILQILLLPPPWIDHFKKVHLLPNPHMKTTYLGNKISTQTGIGTCIDIVDVGMYSYIKAKMEEENNGSTKLAQVLELKLVIIFGYLDTFWRELLNKLVLFSHWNLSLFK